MHQMSPRSGGGRSPLLSRFGYSFCALIMSLPLCSGGQVSSSTARDPLSLNVPPGAQSAVSFNAGPDAQCAVRAQNTKEAGEGLTVFADDDGTATFYVEPPRNGGGRAKLVASCASGPAQTIDVQSVAGTKPVPHTQTARGVQGTDGKHIRPALSGNPMTLSERELISRGYPARPDPEKSPDAYAAWLRAVSKPATQVVPKLISVPHRYHAPMQIENSPAASSNWSGYALVGTSSPFDFISGNWNVPVTYGSDVVRTVYSALWIGLDGAGSDNVVQDGTGQDAVTFDNGFGLWTIRAYYGWKEICCQEPEVRFSNLPVNPGDEIGSYVWMADSSKNLNPFGGIAYFWFEDVTSGQYAYVTTNFASGVFSGNSAEWIMERPTVNNNLPELANYSVAVMWNPWAHRADNRWYGYTGGDEVTSQQITMFNASGALSTVLPLNVDHMQFQWLAYH
ncbi:MAG: G1 family glutamic endopeptidase [Bryobacteraceae bacterium]